MSSVHEPKYFESDRERVLTHDDVKNVYVLSLTKESASSEILFDANKCLETKIKTPVDAEIWCIVEVDLNYFYKMEQ